VKEGRVVGGIFGYTSLNDEAFGAPSQESANTETSHRSSPSLHRNIPTTSTSGG
jgi:hypothetical protein